jgi:hypothetical protein
MPGNENAASAGRQQNGVEIIVKSKFPIPLARRRIAILQAQPGFWHRFYKGTSGTMQLGVSYSYTHRSTWVGTGVEPMGIENIVITSFRYYLP